MTIRKFLRQEMRRDVALTFRLSKHHYEDFFLPVVEIFSNRFNIREHGRRTAVFLLLLKAALNVEKEERKSNDWREKEIAFVKLTREQEEATSNAQRELAETRHQLSKMIEENAYLRDTLDSVSKLLQDRVS